MACFWMKLGWSVSDTSPLLFCLNAAWQPYFKANQYLLKRETWLDCFLKAWLYKIIWANKDFSHFILHSHFFFECSPIPSAKLRSSLISVWYQWYQIIIYAHWYWCNVKTTRREWDLPEKKKITIVILLVFYFLKDNAFLKIPSASLLSLYEILIYLFSILLRELVNIQLWISNCI